MKIFGKRNVVAPPSDGIGGDCNNSSNATISSTIASKVVIDEDVPSYFTDTSPTTPTTSSTKTKKNQRKDRNNTTGGGQSQINGEEIQTLLAMDPSTLNAKQRRLVRRHHERDEQGGEIANASAASSGEVESIDDKISNNTADERNRSNEMMKGETSEQNKQTILPAKSDIEQSVSNLNIADILAKLEGLNSKDRRKLLRQLKTLSGGTIDESVISAAEEKARNVAERNEKEAANNNNNPMADKKSTDKPAKKRKSSDTKEYVCNTPSIVEVSKATTRKRRKKGPSINLAELSPEERQRREEQRLSQQQAAERRVAGLVDPDRHPLNSERRRANRRKPGKAALIAQAKKEQLAEKGKFNAFGYQKRKGGGSS